MFKKYPQIINIDNTLYYGSKEKVIQVPRRMPDGFIKDFVPGAIMPDMPNTANFGRRYKILQYMFLEERDILIVQIGKYWYRFKKETSI